MLSENLHKPSQVSDGFGRKRLENAFLRLSEAQGGSASESLPGVGPCSQVHLSVSYSILRCVQKWTCGYLSPGVFF